MLNHQQQLLEQQLHKVENKLDSIKDMTYEELLIFIEDIKKEKTITTEISLMQSRALVMAAKKNPNRFRG